MKFNCFHFLPYIHADLNFRDKGQTSLWMLYEHDFDAEKCHALYERYLNELCYVDELGFDGVCVNEHHQTPHSLMPAPNVIAGALTQRIKNAKILILGRALPLLDNPLSVAEEWAMLDNMSAGRIITGIVRGIGIEYHAAGVNPCESQERYIEAHDLLVRAWTEAGPFAFEGKYYHYEYVNPFPRPYQQPHPPIWIPSGGNPETIRWAAASERRYTYVQFFNAPYKGVKKTLLQYKEEAKNHGYQADQYQLGWAVPSYVAKTDEQAIAEAKPHIEALFNDFMAFPKELLLPPGYTHPNAYLAASSPSAMSQRKTIEWLLEQGIVHIGSPETVRKRIQQAHEEIGIGHFLPMLHFGTLPEDLTRENMRLYAEEVMSPLKEQYPV